MLTQPLESGAPAATTPNSSRRTPPLDSNANPNTQCGETGALFLSSSFRSRILIISTTTENAIAK